MKYSNLLAKRSAHPESPEPEQTLVGHTQLVLKAVEVFNEIFSQNVANLLKPEISLASWQAALWSAAWLHDVGKANDHFQQMIRQPNYQQGVRHETLGLIVIAELLDPWLQGFWNRCPSWLKAAVLFAVGGHHLKFPDRKEREHTEVTFLGSHPQIRVWLELGKKKLSLAQPPNLTNCKYSLLAFDGIKQKLRSIRRQYDLEFSPSQKLFIAALKSTLMAADVAGSALPAKGKDVHTWLSKRLSAILQEEQLLGVVQQKLKGQPVRQFQQRVVETGTNTVLLEAGCGSGKTAAAYLWSAKHAQRKRLFLCYPTTTTASEGFGGYLHDPDFEAILIHSRAVIDYRLLESIPPRTKAELELRSLKLEAFDTWPIPVAVCTAHTVLGLLQNVRRGIYAWPSLVRSVFVFDEVHSFSERLFQHLLRFMEIFHTVPILLMTATLPPRRKEALEKVCRHRGGLAAVGGPRNRESAKRYVLQLSKKGEAWYRANQVLHSGGRVLWICNTVGRAINTAVQAMNRNLPVQLFHSRYRYRDRLTRQRTVIDGFLPEKPPMLAVTTQVAEMSLDLSADLIVTEYAPIASLIQRLGRVNRFEDEPPTAKPALFVKPDNAMPYADKQGEVAFWQPVEQWLNDVATGSPQSQSDLAAAFLKAEEGSNRFEETSLFCDWIDDPWSSLKDMHALMEAGYTVELVREEDLEDGELAEIAIPMPLPKGNSWQDWQYRGRYLVAPTGSVDYHPFWGAIYARGKS